MSRVCRVYLAGPDVFLPNARDIGARKRELCCRYGLEGAFPLDKEADLSGLSPRAQGMAIYRVNAGLMDSCDVCIAHCTPFRGPSMDVGTAVEIGTMAAQGKPVWGYSNVGSRYRERVGEADGMDVEQFELSDNLMIEGAIEASGGRFICGDAPSGELYTWLELFEACVRQLALMPGCRPAT